MSTGFSFEDSKVRPPPRPPLEVPRLHSAAGVRQRLAAAASLTEAFRASTEAYRRDRKSAKIDLRDTDGVCPR